MYFHSDASWSAPTSVRAPQTTVPKTGNVRRQLSPSGFSAPFSASVSVYASPREPRTTASVPAGAFQTPRSVSVRA